MVLHCIHGVTNDIVMRETASRNYELESVVGDHEAVRVDGLNNPLITLQIGDVR